MTRFAAVLCVFAGSLFAAMAFLVLLTKLTSPVRGRCSCWSPTA